jgi:aspartate racemase
VGAVAAAGAGAGRRGGADGVVLCTNTMHKLARYIEDAVPIPLLHIVDATAAALRADGRRRVGLLGTRFTMDEPFYGARMQERHGIAIRVPGAGDRAEVNRVIYEELVFGRVLDRSRRAYDDVIARLADDGCDAVILGCTEIALLYPDGRAPLPAYDSTRLHAAAAVAWACESGRGSRRIR